MKIGQILLSLSLLCLACTVSSPPERAFGAKVPPRYSEGEKEKFWVWDLNVMPPAFRELEAIHRISGPNSYIFVEEKFDHLFSSDFVEKLHGRLEVRGKKESLFPDLGSLLLNQKAFAPLPTVIHPDPRVVILFSDLGSFKGHSFNGFFNGFDQMPKKIAWEKFKQRSNEVNMIYIHVSEEKKPKLEHATSIITHESQHLLSLHATDLGSDFSQVSWLSEALAEGAMLLNGYYTDQKQVDRFTQKTWEVSLVSSKYVDYGISLLFASYIIDNLGGWEAFKWLTENPFRGQKAIEELIRVREGRETSFASVYRDFIHYTLGAAREKQKLPKGWKETKSQLKVDAILPVEKIKKLPFTMEGKLESYSFAILKIDESLKSENLSITLKQKENPEEKESSEKREVLYPEKNPKMKLKVNIMEGMSMHPDFLMDLGESQKKENQTCDKNKTPLFWEFIPEGILLYSTNCPYQEEKHSVQYEVQVKK